MWSARLLLSRVGITTYWPFSSLIEYYYLVAGQLSLTLRSRYRSYRTYLRFLLVAVCLFEPLVSRDVRAWLNFDAQTFATEEGSSSKVLPNIITSDVNWILPFTSPFDCLIYMSSLIVGCGIELLTLMSSHRILWSYINIPTLTRVNIPSFESVSYHWAPLGLE